METAAGDGVRLWWETSGSGEPVLLMPGRGDSSDLFPARFSAALTDAGLGVIRYDPRDTGLSGDGGDLYTLGDMAQDALAVLDAAEVDAAHLIGISMAGLIISDVASQAPERILSVTLISAASPDPDAGIGPDFFDMIDLDPAEALVRSMGSPDDDDRAWAAAEVAAAERRAPMRPEAGMRHQDSIYRSEWPTVEQLSQVSAPTMVIHGAADRTLPIGHAEAFAERIPRAELVIMDGMGHLPRPSEWDTIAARVTTHLTRARSTGA